MFRRLLGRLLVTAFMLGAVLYWGAPGFKALQETYADGVVADDFARAQASAPPDDVKRAVEAARAYNASLQGVEVSDPWPEDGVPADGGSDPAHYDPGAQTPEAPKGPESPEHAAYSALLNEYGPLGNIVIDKIGVNLPIYHDVSQESLAEGAGHMYGTSLPVGGKGTHAVIAAHTGWPGRPFFDNLDELVEGDTFQVKTAAGTLTYQVDNLAIVYPEDLSLIQPEKGKDLVTLVTCRFDAPRHAPWRLLVRGHRVETPAQEAPVSSPSPQAPREGAEATPDAREGNTSTTSTPDATAAPQSAETPQSAERAPQSQSRTSASLGEALTTEEGREAVQDAVRSATAGGIHGEAKWATFSLGGAAALSLVWLLMALGWVISDVRRFIQRRKNTTA